MNTSDPLKSAAPNRYRFTNPAYRPDHLSVQACNETSTSRLAYKVASIIATAQLAFENDTSGVPMNQRGLGETLELASAIAMDLITECEMLEKRIHKLD